MLLPPVARNGRTGSNNIFVFNIFVFNNFVFNNFFSLETMSIGSQDLTMKCIYRQRRPACEPPTDLYPKSILTQKLNIAIIIVFTR